MKIYRFIAFLFAIAFLLYGIWVLTGAAFSGHGQ